MTITGEFGFHVDFATNEFRRWHISNGIKVWSDTLEQVPTGETARNDKLQSRMVKGVEFDTFKELK